MMLPKVGRLFFFGSIAILTACQRTADLYTHPAQRVYSASNDFGNVQAVVGTDTSNTPIVSFKIVSNYSAAEYWLVRYASGSAPQRVQDCIGKTSSIESLGRFENTSDGQVFDGGARSEDGKQLKIGQRYVYFLIPLWHAGIANDPPGFNSVEAQSANNPNRDSFITDWLDLEGRFSFIFRIDVEIK
ncbi:MAG: hypothetical protein HY537_00490 [Deltaproteobacteria bacterium]|nr:hypothetical protein [Deltaproteobacteria bacterium]